MARTPLAWACLITAACMGCAFAAEPIAMVPDVAPARKPQAATVNVRGSGGALTRLWGKSQISDAALTEALETALADSGLFVPLEDRAGDYQLEVVIEHVQQPTWSLVTTVTVQTHWSFGLTGASDPIWTGAIVGTDTATLLDAMIGTKRCRLATEGAARRAIRDGVMRLAKLRLPGPAQLPFEPVLTH